LGHFVSVIFGSSREFASTGMPTDAAEFSATNAVTWKESSSNSPALRPRHTGTESQRATDGRRGFGMRRVAALPHQAFDADQQVVENTI
jgi:hypothetical protein